MGIRAIDGDILSSDERTTGPLTAEGIIVPAPGEGEVVYPLRWFDSPGPVELEIGCGKGGFLLHRARAHPEVRLLGIEWANKFYRYAADRMARWGMTNVRVLRTDARAFVLRHLAPGCLQAIHLYHPDPWPKKRHHKRRLVQTDFAAAAIRALEPGAEWLIQTDHREYFEHITSVLGTLPELIETPWDSCPARPGDDWTGTNYEIKYARAGIPSYRVAYRKPS
jgi:tRNA (guanine-N7-)-methyltransferase